MNAPPIVACVALVACAGQDAGVPAADVAAAPDAGADVPEGYGPLDGTLRLNQIQTKGTHNSYHLPPEGATDGGAWSLTMAPLDVQLDEQGVRHVELDVHFDPAQGFVVHHIPVLDPETTCVALSECLAVMKGWSDAHPGHHALFMLIELKDEQDAEKLAPHLDAFDDAVLAVWPRERLVTPDDLLAGHPTLRAAATAGAWPTLGASRGKAVFVLMGDEDKDAAYLEGHPSLAGRVGFLFAEPEDDHVAFVKRDDPDEEAIRALVLQGLMVRTRADAGGIAEARAGDTARRDAALRSGAHLVSTDFPVPWTTGFVLDVPGGNPSRCNPVSAPVACTPAAVESL